MKLNANGEPIDRWNEHDLPDAERELLIAKLTNRCTESASLRELKQVYFNDKWDLFSGYSDEELLEEYSQITGDDKYDKYVINKLLSGEAHGY